MHLRRRCIPLHWMECPEVSMRSILSNVLFKICVSLLIFCFDDLSIDVSEVLNSATIIVLLSVSPFMSVSVCLMYLLRCYYVGCIQLLCLLLRLIP